MKRTRSPLALAFAFAAPMLTTGPAQAQMTELGNPFGGNWSRASGVSADGSVVTGWASYPNTDQHAFIWTEAGGMVDLGTLGGSDSWAEGISADGLTVVGSSYDGAMNARAFRWTQAGGMVDLGTLGGTESWANAASADGAVVVGSANVTGDASEQAFRWVLGAVANGTTHFDTTGGSGGAMVNLGTLGGNHSYANGVSADGSVVVGSAWTGGGDIHAFRWVLGAVANGTTHFDTAGSSGGAMVDLGTLGGDYSSAYGVSADGAVVVGYAKDAGSRERAFLWTNAGGMVDLGTLGGTEAWANAVSADGLVVVGGANIAGDASDRAFRWTQASGMQSVEDWLRTAGIAVPTDITKEGYATNGDGSVVVGRLQSNLAFVARVSSVGSGLVTLADVQNSLTGTASGGSMALASGGLLINGAHSRPLSRRVAAGQKTFWLAGDWGTDDHGSRSGDIGLAEVGMGKNFGPLQANISLGQTRAEQDLVLDGRAQADGSYLLAEALVPVAGNLWAVLGAHGHWGDADLKRGYLNAGAQDHSSATPDTATWGLRARLEWDRTRRLAGADFSPYLDLTYSEARLDGYTETGGGFPARFDRRKDKATELRVGVNADQPLANGLNLIGTLEAAHRFEKTGARTTGEVVGLFGFALDGQANKQDWLRAGVGVEGKLAGGGASLMLNATTRGSAPSYWLAANWQRAF